MSPRTQQNATVELCRALVQCESLTPEDAGCQALINDRLQAIGFDCEALPCGQVTNTWARRGKNGPLFVFAGHTDVVPVGDAGDWRAPPFAARIIDDELIGRGVADMKGSVAAMVTAVERFLAQCPEPRADIAFLLTSDEEGPARDGTRHVIDTLRARHETIDWCLVGEPSSQLQLGDTIRLGRRGSLSVSMTVRGVQGHVAYPQLADNPIHAMAPFLADLVAIRWDEGDAHFPPTTLQVSSIQSGTGAGNVIPGLASMQFNLRHAPTTTPDQIIERIEALAARHELKVHFDWNISAEPFMTPPGELYRTLDAIIRERCALDTQANTGGGTSDGRFIARWAKEVIEFGPSNATIHQIDERLSVDELIKLSELYESLLHRLIGEG